jgi:hypothetical protein
MVLLIKGLTGFMKSLTESIKASIELIKGLIAPIKALVELTDVDRAKLKLYLHPLKCL